MDNRNPILGQVISYLAENPKREFYIRSVDASFDLGIKTRQFSAAMKSIRFAQKDFDIEKRKRVWLVKKK